MYPYLRVNGAAAAVEFYCSVFGAANMFTAKFMTSSPPLRDVATIERRLQLRVRHSNKT
jgi:uncharacterized glyoxalase superfamily protein PhnB